MIQQIYSNKCVIQFHLHKFKFTKKPSLQIPQPEPEYMYLITHGFVFARD